MANATGQQQFDVAVPGTVESVWEAVMKVVTDSKFKKVDPSPTLHMVTFISGASMMTSGQRWMVQVSLGVDGQPHVSANVSPRVGTQPLDAGRISKLATQFYQGVAQAA